MSIERAKSEVGMALEFSYFTPGKLNGFSNWEQLDHNEENRWLFRQNMLDDEERVYILEIYSHAKESHVSLSIRNQNNISANVLNNVRRFSIGKKVVNERNIDFVRFEGLRGSYFEVRNDGFATGSGEGFQSSFEPLI